MKNFANRKSPYEVTCDGQTGVCTAKLRVSPRKAYEIPQERRGAWVDARVAKTQVAATADNPAAKAEYLGYGLKIEKREVEVAKRTVRFTASTPQIDRYGDVIEQSGWELGNYKSNPIILFAHDSRALPIGKALQCAVGKTGNLEVEVEFSRAIGSYDLPEIVLQYIAEGFLNTVSVGFIPTEYKYRYEEVAEGEDPKPWPVGRIYTKSELLEISVVPVPANPGAVVIGNSFAKAFNAIEVEKETRIVSEPVERAYFVLDEAEDVVYEHGSTNPTDHEDGDASGRRFLLVKMYADGQTRPFVLKQSAAGLEAEQAMERDQNATQGFFCSIVGFDDEDRPVYRSDKRLVRTEINPKETPSQELEKEKMAEKECTCKSKAAAEAVEKSVVPYHKYPLAPASATWDAGKEMGSTDKPEDWRKMSTIVLNDGKNKGDFKLPHHKGPGAKFATVRRGVAAALARTNQVKGASDADKKGARAHLVKHMAEFHAKDGKAFDETAFEKNIAAFEEMRDSFADGSAEQETAIRVFIAYLIDPEQESSGDALSLARSWGMFGKESRAEIIGHLAKAFPVEEGRKFTDEKMNRKMAKAHKSMTRAQDELHEAHEDAMDMLGQACAMVDSVINPAGGGKGAGENAPAAPSLGAETVASKIGKAYDMAYEAKKMVRRAASRYADHMQDAVDHLEALVGYTNKDSGDDDPDGDGDAGKPDPDDVSGEETGDTDASKVNNPTIGAEFVAEVERQAATKFGIPASDNSVRGDGTHQAAPTAGSDSAEEVLTQELLRLTTANDQAAH